MRTFAVPTFCVDDDTVGRRLADSSHGRYDGRHVVGHHERRY